MKKAIFIVGVAFCGVLFVALQANAACVTDSMGRTICVDDFGNLQQQPNNNYLNQLQGTWHSYGNPRDGQTYFNDRGYQIYQMPDISNFNQYGGTRTWQDNNGNRLTCINLGNGSVRCY
jgi:hypothetical protein